MALIESTFIYSAAPVEMKTTILDGDDTFVYNDGVLSCLILHNVTESELDINIDGDEAVPVAVGGIGDIDVTDGSNTGPILPGDLKVVPLSNIYEYLKGNIKVTGGAGIAANLLEFISWPSQSE